MSELVFEEESYRIIGICMNVHTELGPGFLENVYKDALEYEFQKNKIPFQREKVYPIEYKDIILKHVYIADFVLFDKIILEVKAVSTMSPVFPKICLNYCRAANCCLTLLVNFGEISLTQQRIVLGEKYSDWLVYRTTKDSHKKP